MRLVATRSVMDGTILGKPIYNDNGQVLLNEGVVLGEVLIRRLESKGVHYVYVQDGKTDDIKLNYTISEALRKKAVSSIESTFSLIQNGHALSAPVVIEKATEDLSDIVKNLLSEVKNNNSLLTILSDVFTYDHYIFMHSLNVTLYSLAIGLHLKIPLKDLEVLGLGAILHDIGKVKVREPVIFKPGKLTEEEFTEMKNHTSEGYEILRNVKNLPNIVANCAFQHHERLNGSGYPRGITANDMIDFAKIIAVADVFDAVTSNRIYRKAMLPHEGLEVLYAGSGTLFEPYIIEAFRQSVAIYPVGITVELSDGRKGVVSGQNLELSDRPIVKVLEENGREIAPYELNLRSELNIVIIGCDTNSNM